MREIQSMIARFFKNRKGQDLVEYALLAGFIAVAAGALLPPIADSISTIFSRMASVVSVAAAAKQRSTKTDDAPIRPAGAQVK